MSSGPSGVQRRWKTSRVHGHVVQRSSTRLWDHVATAVRTALAGERAFVRATDARDLLLEFRLTDQGLLRVSAIAAGVEVSKVSPPPGGWPAWFDEALTIVERLDVPYERSLLNA